MLKIGCFKLFLSKITVSQVCLKLFPMQFFAKQLGKSCCCDQFHTYAQWFAAKFNFSNFQ